MLVHRRVTSSIKFASTHLYTWWNRGTARGKCAVQEHNTMFLASSNPDRTILVVSAFDSGRVERTNHEDTSPAHRRNKECHQLMTKKTFLPYRTMIILRSNTTQDYDVFLPSLEIKKKDEAYWMITTDLSLTQCTKSSKLTWKPSTVFTSIVASPLDKPLQQAHTSRRR